MWRDPEPGVRAAAAGVIGALDDPRKTRVLGHALLDEAEAVRSAAEGALRASGIDAAQAAALAATPRAPDPRPHVERHPDDLKALREAQLDPNRWRRVQAVAQLAKHKERERETVDALLEALADPDTYVRKTAVESLAVHARRDPRVVPALVEAVSDYAARVVESAVEAVGKLKLEEAVRPIRERLLASARDYSSKMQALLLIGGPDAAAALGDALTHASADVRGYALYALGRLGAAAAAPHLVKALADPDDTVRLGAAHALGELKSGEAVAPLVASYRSPSKGQRHAAVTALGQLGGPEVVRVLVAALRDRHHDVREAAAAGLVKQKDARGNRALVSAAKRGDRKVAAEAWQYLVGQGEPGTEEALHGALGGGRDDATRAAGCFLQCGNPKLAKLARGWLEGRRPPKDAPRIKWGSRRVTK
jgi:HEAT repeat protein